VPWFRTPLIVRREALHDAGIGEEGFPALFVERLELGQVLTDSGDLHLGAAHEAEGVRERAEMAEGGHFSLAELISEIQNRAP